ncbi:MAG: DUF5522 domain-containing protein [Polyangiaceae bacterium]
MSSSPRHPPEPPWRAAHAKALADGAEHYVDPLSGLLVFTEHYHRRRGKCCGSACRHCPFDHENVPKRRG